MNTPIGIDMRHRTALVTGADSGMGQETARALAAMGAHVLLGCRNPQLWALVNEQLASAGHSASTDCC